MQRPYCLLHYLHVLDLGGPDQDLLDKVPPHEEHVRPIRLQLRELIRGLRLGGRLLKAELLLFDTSDTEGRGRILQQLGHFTHNYGPAKNQVIAVVVG